MKLKVFAATAVLLFFNIITVFATGPGLPCDDNSADPDDVTPGGACPIDTWVIILVLAALLLTVIHLHRKQKAQFTIS